MKKTEKKKENNPPTHCTYFFKWLTETHLLFCIPEPNQCLGTNQGLEAKLLLLVI